MTRDEAEKIVAEELRVEVDKTYIPRWIRTWERLGFLKLDAPLVDPYVYQRAVNNADRPYDADTCKRYPHAAAARILFLEAKLARIKSYLP